MNRYKQKAVLLFGVGVCLSLYNITVNQIEQQCHDIIPSVNYVDQDAQELWRELTELQHPQSCSDQPALVYIPVNAGLGSEIHWLTVALSIAYREQRTMVLDSAWVYGDCANKDLSCFFVSQGCSRANLGADVKFTTRPQIVAEREYIPFKYRHRGQLWWRSQLVAFLLSGTKATREQINRQRVVVPKPYTSVHIRQGDACTNEKFGHSCLPVSKYMEAIREKGYPKTLFISTDSQKVVEELEAYSSEFKMFFANEYRSEGSVAIELKQSQADTTFVTVSLLANLELLAEGNAFVGTFASNIGRIVYELMYYEKHGLVNYVSLDMPYFFAPGIPVKNMTQIVHDSIANHR